MPALDSEFSEVGFETAGDLIAGNKEDLLHRGIGAKGNRSFRDGRGLRNLRIT